MNCLRRCAVLLLLVMFSALCSVAQEFSFRNSKAITILYDSGGTKLDSVVANLFADDIKSLTGSRPSVATALTNVMGKVVIIGNVSSVWVRRFVPEQSTISRTLSGQWERFAWKIIEKPSKQISQALIITGSDTRGTAYGVFSLSEKLGISPWYWWADVLALPRTGFVLKESEYISSPPSVKYRGIFLNDEDWGLNPWSSRTYEPGIAVGGKVKGAIGPKTYARIFELLLRLRANTIWPAMHEVTLPFYFTPGNKEMADLYGIVVGTSHCEPLMRNSAGEWDVAGKGDYNYLTNKEEMLAYWTERLKILRGSENIYTIGLRGKHDGMMQGVKTLAQHKAVLSKVIDDQRLLLQQNVNPAVSKLPQIFVPYKEVLDVYTSGMPVPDDVTLVWCDDNYGYIRHFPNEQEQRRNGGNGVYYHVSYWGRPHDYLWLGTASPGLLYHQMKLAYDKKARQIWILNVGDIKANEYQTALFLDMAWDIDKVTEAGVNGHHENWLRRSFGNVAGSQLAPLMREHYRLAYIRKPEFMGNTRVEEHDASFSVVRDLPWSEVEIKQRLAAYDQLSLDVETLGNWLPKQAFASYYELVRYPVQASVQMNRKLLYAQLARHGKADWNQSDRALDSIISLNNAYDSLKGGKWKGVMDFQPRKLPVFRRVSRETARGALPEYRKPVYLVNGIDMQHSHKENALAEGLGYNGGAVKLSKGESLFLDMTELTKDSIDVEIGFVPNHAVEEGSRLRFSVSLDGGKIRELSYETGDRSEEWKVNVLRNQAIRRVVLKVGEGKTHRLVISALDDEILVDQIRVY